MPEEPFFERFRRLLDEAGLRPEQAASIMQTGIDSVRRLSDGRTKQARLDEAIRLCDYLGVSPYYLANGRDREPTAKLRFDDREVALDLRFTGEAPGEQIAATVESTVRAALEGAGIEVEWMRGFLRTTPASVEAASGGLTAAQAAVIEQRLGDILARVAALEAARRKRRRSPKKKGAARAHRAPQTSA